MPNIDLRPVLSSALLSIQAMDGSPKLKSAHLGNALSLLHASFGETSWVGLYLLNDGELILGPFQGSMACEAIQIGKGVVGECFKRNETMTVSDVTTWPNYICCDAAAKSEICVPIRDEGGKPFAVLDIDLPYTHEYDDEKSLFEQVAEALSRFC